MRLKPVAYSLESAYGSVKPSRRPEDFDALSRVARDARAEQTLQKMSEGGARPDGLPAGGKLRLFSGRATGRCPP